MNPPDYATLDRVRIRSFQGRACFGPRLLLRDMPRGVGGMILAAVGEGRTCGHAFALDRATGVCSGLGWFVMAEPEPPPNAVRAPGAIPEWNPTIKEA